MSGPGAVNHVGSQQPILTLVLREATAQELASKTKTLTLVLRDALPDIAVSELSNRITIVLHDPAVKKAELKKAIAFAEVIFMGINEQLSSHRPQEGSFGGRKITVLLSSTVNPHTTQHDIEAIAALRVTVEKIEGIIFEHTAGFEADLKKELEHFSMETNFLKSRCNCLTSKQQDVSAMQAQASRVHKAMFGVNF